MAWKRAEGSWETAEKNVSKILGKTQVWTEPSCWCCSGRDLSSVPPVKLFLKDFDPLGSVYDGEFNSKSLSI